MTTSQVWTGIILVSMVVFMTLRTVMRIKKQKRVLPSLQNISGGPFSSTRTGSEGIILPVLNYRRDVASSSLSKNRRQRTVKEKREPSNDGTEILEAMKLIEQHQLKFIDEDRGLERCEKVSAHVDHHQSFPQDTDNVGLRDIL